MNYKITAEGGGRLRVVRLPGRGFPTITVGMMVNSPMPQQSDSSIPLHSVLLLSSFFGNQPVSNGIRTDSSARVGACEVQ